MIYEYKTHSLYYKTEEILTPNFSLSIDTLELIYGISNGKLLGIQGFFPIVKAVQCDIIIPRWERKDYFIHNYESLGCKQNRIYDLDKKVPNSARYFKPLDIRFDKNRGIIQIGKELLIEELVFKVDENITCGCDTDLNLKTIYIIPNIFI